MEAVRRLSTLCASTVSAPPKKQESVLVRTVSFTPTDLGIRAMSKLRTGKLNHGDRVEIYRNLHNGTHSVRRDGKVVKHLQHSESIFLQDVKFAVQPAGREKVRREGKKNVHAFVRGTVIKADAYNFAETFKEKCNYVITYNPYHMEHFGTNINTSETDKKGRPYTMWTYLYEAKLATFTGGYLYAAI